MPRLEGILMFRRTLLDAFPLKSRGRSWVILVELVYRAVRGGYRTVSCPHRILPRQSGFSKVNNLRTIWANLRELLRLRSIVR